MSDSNSPRRKSNTPFVFCFAELRIKKKLKSIFKKTAKLIIEKCGYEIKKLNSLSSIKLRAEKLFMTHKFDTILDVGAFDGAYAKIVRDAGFIGRIISFEPLSVAYAELLKNSKKDENWIIAPQMAIGDKDCTLPINVSANTVSSSVLEMEEIHLAGAPGSQYVSTEVVNMHRLDSIANCYIGPKNVVFLKIDVQGYEFEVLEGAKDTLSAVKGMQLELSLAALYKEQKLFIEMLDHIKSCGFELFDLEPIFRDINTGRLLQLDGIFLRI